MMTVTGVRKTATVMADGRELLYYDTDPGVVRDAVDRRALPPRPDAPRMRFDALTGEWVAIAAARQTRVMLPAAHECPVGPRQALLAEVALEGREAHGGGGR